MATEPTSKANHDDSSNAETPEGVTVRKRTGEAPAPDESGNEGAEPTTTAADLVSGPPAAAAPSAPVEPAAETTVPEPAAETTVREPAAEATASEAAPDSAAGAEASGAEQPAAKPAKRRAGRPKTADETRREIGEPDFGDLLEATTGRISQQTIEQGEMVEGTIIAFSGEYAFVDLGGKTEGILAIEELRGDDGDVTHGIGESVETFVTSTTGGEIRLSFALGRQIRDAEALFDAAASGMPVEGRVIGTNKGGFEVRIAGRRAFCPISQIDVAYTEDPNAHIGQTYVFKLKEVSRDGKRIVVSRAAYLREKLAAQKQEVMENLHEGMELAGIVTSVQEYGAFVDIGGVEGLVHVSELSWSRVEHPNEVIQSGDEVNVQVLSIKQTDKGERISLSIRQTTPHPWVQVGTKFVEGEAYDGTVVKLEPFGAFVELGPGVEGLVHVSEMSWTEHVKHPNEILTVGQPVRVYIKNIEDKRRRIGLSIKALEGDPWSGVRDRYPVGSQVEGVVEKVQPFGVFVEVEPGITALIPASESNTGTGTDLRREFEPGKKVTATVLNVEPGRRRMSLSLKAAAELKDQAAMRDYFSEQKKAEEQGSGFGTLGDLFKDKLK